MRPQYHSPNHTPSRWVFRPYEETEPGTMRWRCTACGHMWETVTAILPRALGCPECGGKAGIVEGGET